MNAAAQYGPAPEDWPDEEQDTLPLPGRPRRRLWGPASAILLALLVGAAGFYLGVRVEKGQVSGGSVAGGGSAVASRLAALAGGTRGSGAARAPGTAGGFAGGSFARALAGGNGSFGTVSAVHGNVIYLTDATGNTVKVTLSSATAITKSLGVSAKSVHPGDALVVQGLKRSDGSIVATSVNDSGARAGQGSGTGSSGSGSSSASSAVNSLF